MESFEGNGLELSTCHLYNATGRVDAAATLSSTWPPSAGTLSNLQDTDLATTCSFSEHALRAPSFALLWDFGEGNSAEAIVPRLGSTTEEYYLRSATLQFFDGTQWQTQVVLDSFAFPGANTLAPEPDLDDPYIADTPLVVSFESAILDGSMRPHRIATNGVARSADQHKFGSFSGAFNNAATLDISAADDLSLPADFTVEFWVFFSEVRSLQGLLNIGNYVTGALFRVNASSLEAFLTNGNASWPISISSGQWYHIAWTRSGGTVRAWLNGTQVGSVATLTGSVPALPVQIGRSAHAPNEYLNGYMDGVRITRGHARYTTDFTVPDRAFPDFLGVVDPPILRTVAVSPELFAAAPAGDHPVVTTPVISWRDMYFDGDGFIAGTVKRDADPADIPLKRRVRLHREHDGLPVRETWSDPVTGAYTFPQISRDFVYTVVAYDYLHDYRAVIADNIVPEVMT